MSHFLSVGNVKLHSFLIGDLGEGRGPCLTGGREELKGEGLRTSDHSNVQTLLQQMQDKFQTMSDQIIGRIDEMSTRIDDLEKNIADLMTQAGVEESEGESKAVEGQGA
ncbi:heat shock factor-binding protein 1 isoform X1 [Anguilla anguilla]|uniref:heat shock factor-binding protein 1 isoform X1 n=1 Tax=Anguilla anguilla TaxID=7936 RepID=UPI0015B222CD|nr:heat shock factor-binding protein 1 isoform X1 [Anguilla anguilla]